MTVASDMTPPPTVGVIGAGTMGRVHLAALARLGVPAALFSPSGRGRDLAAKHGAPLCGTVDELVASCQVVDICSPTDTHRPLAEAAFEAGRDVICEKPLALTRADAIAIMVAAEQAGRRLFVAQVVRYFAAYAAAWAAAREGRIGAVRELALSRTGPAPLSAWFGDDQRSGGVLVDQMIHDADFACWVLGEVTSVEASVAIEAGSPVDDGAAREEGAHPGTVRASATLHHANGGVSHLTGGWLGPDRHFTTSLSMAGDTGIIRQSSGSALEWVEAGGRPVELLSAATIAADLPYDSQLADFLTAIRAGTEPRVHAVDGLAALELALAARRSAQTGQPVRL